MKKLINRLKAEETKLGKLFAYYIPSVLAGAAATVEVLEAMQSMPFSVPFDTKEAIAVCTLICIIGGKLTKKKDV